MEQNDSSGMNPSEEFGESFFFGWLVILIPVYIGETPEETFVTKFFCHLKIGFTVFSLRRPIVFGHILSGYVFIGSFYIVQFFLEIFYRRNTGHVGVMPGMVSHGVSFFRYPFDQFRFGVNVGSYNEKSGFYLMLFQCIKDSRSISVFVTGIKSKIQNFFGRILCIISIHRCKFLDRSISNRSFAFFLKT